MRLRSALLFAAFSIVVAFLGCVFLSGTSGCGTTPKQQGDAVEAGCDVVTAFAGTANAESLCATAGELTEIVSSIRTTRADAGRAFKVTSCKIIPQTTTCATDTELRDAIRQIQMQRRDQ